MIIHDFDQGSDTHLIPVHVARRKEWSLLSGPPAVKPCPHATSARPVSGLTRFHGIFEEHPVLHLHSFSGTAGEKSIDLQLPVAGKFYFTALNERLQFLAVEISMGNHAAS